MADDEPRMDPDARALIDGFVGGGLPPWHALSVDSARRLEDELFSAGSGPALGNVRDVAIDGPDGELPLRLYRPEGDVATTVVFLHGGGWTLGTLDSADDICRELADRASSLVVSVDYRLAPEHPFPAGLEDALAAIDWADRHGHELGGPADGLAVCGTSAGGNLAAASTLFDRREHGRIDVLGLLYPIVDRAFDTPSYGEHADAALLSRADMEWFWSQYLRAPVDAEHPYVSVARHPDLARLPPTAVVTAGHDVLRDEGIAFAEAVDAAGVRVEHRHYPALPHGLLSLTDDVASADAAFDEVAETLLDLLAG